MVQDPKTLISDFNPMDIQSLAAQFDKAVGTVANLAGVKEAASLFLGAVGTTAAVVASVGSTIIDSVTSKDPQTVSAPDSSPASPQAPGVQITQSTAPEQHAPNDGLPNLKGRSQDGPSVGGP